MSHSRHPVHGLHPNQHINRDSVALTAEAIAQTSGTTNDVSGYENEAMVTLVPGRDGVVNIARGGLHNDHADPKDMQHRHYSSKAPIKNDDSTEVATPLHDGESRELPLAKAGDDRVRAGFVRMKAKSPLDHAQDRGSDIQR